MDNLLTVAFEAHSSELNHHRRYRITVGSDLLGDWTVSIRYGRIGKNGQELRFASRQPEAMQAVVRNRLRRRLSAPSRLGCAYLLREFSAASGFESGAWLPAGLLAQFMG